MAAMVVAQLLARQQQVLDRVVVQHLREPAALALLGGQHLGQQPAALAGGGADPPVAGAQQGRQHHRSRSGPGEVERVRDDRVDVRARARRGMGEREQHVDSDRGRRPCRGQRRPQAKRRNQRKREERQPCLGVGAARRVGQGGDRQQVHEWLDARQLLHPGQPPTRREQVRTEQRHRPHAVDGQQRSEQIAVRRPGMLDDALPDRHHRHQRDPQQRHPELAARRLFGTGRGVGLRVRCRGHSSSPRRMASATAAARSDTPSLL